MEVDCYDDKCLILVKIKEQLTSNLSSFTETGSSLSLDGERNVDQLLTMHRQDVNNISNNDIIFDKLLGNFSFHNVNIYINDTENIANGPYRINFTDLMFVVLFCLMIIIVIIGNTLVILSVLTTRRLRTVTNLFVTSLALADWLVGIFVMPPAVAYYLMGS